MGESTCLSVCQCVCNFLFVQLIKVVSKYIGDKDPYYNTKIFIFFLLGLVWQLSSVQTKYNEGCSKLNYLLAKG